MMRPTMKSGTERHIPIVTQDVPAGVVVAGCPARIIKEKDERTEAKTALVDALRTL